MAYQRPDYVSEAGEIRIALADDHPIFRDGLRRLLSCEPDFEVVAEVEDGAAVLEMLQAVKPDVLILDLLMPEKDGLTTLKEIRSAGTAVKVIVVTLVDQENSHVLAMKYGASGVVLKSNATQYLIHGIRAVQQGQVWLDNRTLVSVMRQYSDPVPVPEFTSRELEVVSLLCDGRRNKEIADALHVSEETVKSHLQHIFKKTGVSDRTHLVLYAIASKIPLLRSA